MITPRLLAAAVISVLVASFAGTATTLDALPTGAAQQDPGSVPGSTGQPLRIESVTPWVAADGEFQVRFAPAPLLPPDTRLTVTVHQSLRPSGSDTLRGALLSIIDGGPLGRILQAPITTPVSELGDPAAGLVVTLPVRATRADSDRVLLPNPGIHPIELVLTRADGPEIWREVLFLNRLPVDDGDDGRVGAPSAQVRVSLVLPLDAPPAVGTAGEATFSLEDQNALSAAGSLLQQLPDAPLLVSARPNTLDGLARVERRWADTVLDALSAPGSSNTLSLVPYVELDVDSLLDANARRILDRQLLVGAGAIITRTTRTPVVQTWTSDDPIDTRALSAIAQSGFGSAFVPAAALDTDDELADEHAMTTPFRFDGDSGLTGLAYDEQIGTLLADGGASAGSRAHAATSLLMANWFTGLADPDEPRASAVLLSPSTDPQIVELLTAALGGGGPLITDPGAELPRPGGSTVALRPRSAPDLVAAVASFDTTSAQLDSYRSMTGEADPELELWSILNDESMASGLDQAARGDLHTAVDIGVAARLSMIEIPRSRRVVLTSEDTSIPLRFRNGLDFDVTLNLEARSARLDLGDVGTEIVLVPGENRVDLPVAVQAPGETLLRLRLSAPDGDLEVGAVEVPVRSTRISGVGAALSVISIVFLVLWWVLTHRRTRRAGSRSSGAHPALESQLGTDDAPETSAPAGAFTADRLDHGG